MACTLTDSLAWLVRDLVPPARQSKADRIERSCQSRPMQARADIPARPGHGSEVTPSAMGHASDKAVLPRAIPNGLGASECRGAALGSKGRGKESCANASA